MGEQSEDVWVLPVLEGVYVEKPDTWVVHRRSRNYIARIEGFDPTYGLRREFLERVRVGKRTYFKLEDFIPGEVYEILNQYFSSSGRLGKEFHGFFVCEKADESGVYLRRIGEEEVIKIVRERYPETVPLREKQQELWRLERMKEEIQKEMKKIEEKKAKLMKEIEALEKAKKELEESLPKIDPKEVEDVSKKLLERIESLAESLRSIGRDGYYTRISDNEPTIKVGPDYVRVGDVYVISRYPTKSPPSVWTLYNAYVILKKEVEKNLEKLKKIVTEVS